MEPVVDLSLHPARPPVHTLMMTNKLLTATAEQLNSFATRCEDKLIVLHHKMQRLETGVKLLESRLSSLPGGGDAGAPPPAAPAAGSAAAPTAPAGASAAPAAPTGAAAAPEQPPPEPAAPAAPETPVRTMKDAYPKYFKMLMVGVPRPVVDMKFASETGLSSELLDDPSAPAPPDGEDGEGDEG